MSSKTLPSRRLRTQKANRNKRKRRRKESNRHLLAGLPPTAQIATLSLRPKPKRAKRPRRSKKQIRLLKVRTRWQRSPKVSHKQRRVLLWRTKKKRRKKKSASRLLPGKLQVCRSLQGQRAGSKPLQQATCISCATCERSCRTRESLRLQSSAPPRRQMRKQTVRVSQKLQQSSSRMEHRLRR